MRRPRDRATGALLHVLFLVLATTAVAAEPAKAPSNQFGQGSQNLNLYWLEYERGWFWYEDPLVDAPEPPVAKSTDKPAPDAKPPEIVRLEALQKRLENSRKIAIINPTEENVLRYMRLEASMIRQASYFADVAQKLGWANPELDLTLEGRPVNALAIETYNREQVRFEESSLSTIAANHVVFFFFRSDCPYCHAYAPVLKDFADRYGLKVVAVSVDGRGIGEFPDWKKDNGIARTLRVDKVPATFLAQPFSGVITPLGFGVLSKAQLAERIVMGTKSTPDTGRQDLSPLSRLP